MPGGIEPRGTQPGETYTGYRAGHGKRSMFCSMLACFVLFGFRIGGLVVGQVEGGWMGLVGGSLEFLYSLLVVCGRVFV